VKGLYLWGLVERHLKGKEDHRWSLFESSLDSPEVPTHSRITTSKSCSCWLTVSRAVHASCPRSHSSHCTMMPHTAIVLLLQPHAAYLVQQGGTPWNELLAAIEVWVGCATSGTSNFMVVGV
jgi:hypothetical protein